MSRNSFGARGSLAVGDTTYEVFRLAALGETQVETLPFSLRILLENLLRHEDGVSVQPEDIEALARWEPGIRREIAFAPGRILMQDFTGVPALVDLAAMRHAVDELGGDPTRVNPQVPVDLVIDHSIIADVYGVPGAFIRNAELEFSRNEERYAFLKWGRQALDGVRVVPPNTGICHQVNLEYLASVVRADASGAAFPDTLVGTDSHTTMINGLGVLGWGVGGIEAEAAMLGEPIPMLIPPVVGCRLSGALPEGSTATDLVLTVTEMLRRHGVVGKFVEFYGPGVGEVPLENRATIGNMSPEYGSTCAIFPIDEETLRYLRFTGRPPEVVDLVEAYTKDQGLWHDPGGPEAVFSEHLELDLSTVVPSLAGPSRPQDLVRLDRAKAMFRSSLHRSLPEPTHAAPSGRPAGAAPEGPPGGLEDGADEASAESFPASDPPAAMAGSNQKPPSGRPDNDAGDVSDRPQHPVPVRLDGATFDLDHGHVVIAAITSCTNTSNPSVMLAAGILARNAVERGLEAKPWVKTSLAPGSRAVMDYYERAGLLPYLEKLRFNLVGYGCTTCIGNSGPLEPPISAAIEEGGLAVCSVLSGNRNFEGRIHPEVRMNYLASPPLVVAYALAGSLDVDLYTEPLGPDADGNPVFLRDIWPTPADVAECMAQALTPDLFEATYSVLSEGDDRWKGLPAPTGDRFVWDPGSTYIRRPPYFDGMPPEPTPPTDIRGARVLALLGDSVTTDHISPAGVIRKDGPAGRWLIDQGVEQADFNSYGSRRGNHEVMIRGTFANTRVRNQLAPGSEGGVSVHLPSGERTSIYDAAMRYAAEGTPLVVLAGKEYGSGSSRDWAAKGTALLGVRAVLAQSFERIHRSNLIGMGVLPLEFTDGASVESLGLTGEETFDIEGIEGVPADEPFPSELTVRAGDQTFPVRVRIDTPKEADYYRHGGILRYVLRRLAR